ncbi:carbohydrate ABC transporter permease [Tissierella pigra]|uniref:Carbohydrate ABC transporter permease n=1 Tax=Tissierella pigra TaxID=2607614 RepID=A0A6N7XUT4_9FIRM|nr:carbohydrate ABC transporter permease [Tissierella pigra]MBU5427545.1 carbohydrate ABC transporter permease [Tissierella pigra]MSU00294.1 carbohydrate ABC transporter permease [Tissierella pigra]
MAKKILKNLFIYIFSLICILPMMIMIVYSFKGIDGNFSFVQYGRALFQREDFFIGFWNSIMYTFVIIGINIPLSLLSAYGFSRFKFKTKGILYCLYIILMLMPFQATIVAQYLTLKALKIIDKPMAVMIPNIFSTFGTILMAQHMRGINKEILDAGRIDGFGEFRLFLQIVLPVCKSLVYALTVLIFVNYWSMVEQPLVFIKDTADMPLSVTLNASKRFRDIGFACGTLFSILPILLYQFSYDDLVNGISIKGGVKVESLDNREEQGKNKKIISKIIVVFMISMGIFTLFTQKISYMMTPNVEVAQVKSGDLKSNPSDSRSKSLGYYTNIVPNSCIHQEGSDSVIYAIMKEKSKSQRDEVVKIVVTVIESNGIEAAIQGGFSSDTQIIERTTKPLIDGMIVRVSDNRGAIHGE